MSTSLTKIDQVYSNVLYVHIQILRHGFAILCFIFQAILTAKKSKENQSLKEDILNKTYLRKSLRIEIPITLDREDWIKWEDIPANMVAQALWISLRYSTMPWPPKKKELRNYAHILGTFNLPLCFTRMTDAVKPQTEGHFHWNIWLLQKHWGKNTQYWCSWNKDSH